MRFVYRIWNKTLDATYGCGSGVLRVFGQQAWARYVLTHRTMQTVRTHVEMLKNATEDTQLRLKRMTDELVREQSNMERALFDVRLMTQNRIEERKTRAMRMGVPFHYKRDDVIMWMNDYTEIQRIEDLRVSTMKVRRLESRIKKNQYVKQTLQRKQVGFEDAISASEMAEDLDRVAAMLDESNSVDLDHMFNDILSHMHRLNEAVEESVEQTRLLHREVDDAMDIIAPAPLDKTEVQDIMDLIFETTESAKAAPAKAAPAHKEDNRVLVNV